MPTLAEPVKYGEDADIEKAPVLSEEEKHILKKRMEALDLVLATQQIAKYKIELLFGSSYRSGQAYPGAVSFWMSGAKFHGGGDEHLACCPSCDAFIPPGGQGYGHLVCPDCQKVWKGSAVYGEILARNTTQNWAVLIYKYFMKLDGNCDITVKRPRLDLRKAADMEQAKQLGGERLAAYRQKRETCIYPMRNIVKDVSGGADILGRFIAFLKS